MGFTREELERRRDNLNRLIDLADQVEALQQWFQQSSELLTQLDGLAFHQLDESGKAEDYESASREIDRMCISLQAFLEQGNALLEESRSSKPKSAPAGDKTKTTTDSAIKEAILGLLKDGRMYLVEEIVEEIDVPINHAHRVLTRLIKQGHVSKDEETGMYELNTTAAS